MDKKDYEKARDEKFKNESKNRLSSIIRKKIQTTMIGSLSSIEEHFGFLWAEDGPYNEEQKGAMLDVFNKVRSEILDKGNSQSRNVDAELAQYDVKWLRYSMTMPVVPKKD